jgi:uncharacterized protein (DUF433 family)
MFLRGSSMPAAAPSGDSWRRRLYLPNYPVQEAARYAKIAPQTVVHWQKGTALAARREREPLSYMQLIEVAVVAALRKEGVSLKRIRDAREYLSRTLRSEFPFAEYRFKTDGRRLFMDFAEVVGAKRGGGKLLRPDQQGQLAWKAVIGRLKEFDYERHGIVISWHVAGLDSAVVIDPRYSFGAPMVKGVPTWAVKGRWAAGEMPDEIADDFGLREEEVVDALSFEGIDHDQLRKWLH